MRPELRPGRYVYTTLPAGEVPAGVTPVVTVSEREGLTLVVAEAQAVAAGLPYDFVACWIILRVHSALDAVGLTAAVSSPARMRGSAATWSPDSTTTTCSSRTHVRPRRYGSWKRWRRSPGSSARLRDVSRDT